MGLFDLFKKRTPTYEEKVTAAHRCYKPEMANVVFPGGIKQVSNIIISLSKIYGISFELLTANEYYSILTAYSDVFIRRTITNSSDEHIVASLQINHKNFIKNAETAEKVVAFCKLNISDNSFVLDSSEKLQLLMNCSASVNKDNDLSVQSLGNYDDTDDAIEEPEESLYFENDAEFAVYAKLNNAKSGVVWVSNDKYIELYQKGYYFFECGQIAKAVDVYKECLILNPIGVRARFELVECCLLSKQFSLARKYLYEMKDYLYDNSFKAKFYRRVGYISIEEGSFKEAYACYQYSLRFENHPSVLQEMKYIESKAGMFVKRIDIERTLVKHNIPML